MKKMMVMTLGLATLGGCINEENRIPFDGHFFRTKVRAVEKQIDVFTVTIPGVSRSFDGAREAGRYAATEYCVNNYGSSDIIWTVGPDTPKAQLNIEKDTIVFQGKCPN